VLGFSAVGGMTASLFWLPLAAITTGLSCVCVFGCYVLVWLHDGGHSAWCGVSGAVGVGSCAAALLGAAAACSLAQTVDCCYA
jgi:hypothetical protein